jgi:hypothetical protein
MSLPSATEPNGTARLSRTRRLGIYGVGVGLWLSGALWLLFHYFLQVEGPFGSRPHGLEAWWLRLHGAFGFASLWLLGLLWGAHIAHAWSTRRKRWSGSLLLAGLAWLVVSGYLLYYLGDDALRADAALLHWTFGLACPAIFLTHRLARRDRVPATRPEPSAPSVAGSLETARSR